MQTIQNFFYNFFDLANAMSIYILFGLILAGVLKELLPADFISKHLGKSNVTSVLKATIFGIPMPVCSCSVIPLAKSLQKEGASAGAVQSFLIATPITGVDSILATYSFFGWFFTLYRVVTSMIMAIVAGILQNLFYTTPKIALQKSSFSLTQAKVSNFNVISFNTTTCTSSCCASSSQKSQGFSIKRVFNYAFHTLFSDIAKSLFIGLVIGALFTTFLPKELLGSMSDNLILTYLLIIAISMPLYVCATSSLPIGAALLLSGLPLGAVFVFLSAGPATNSVTMSVVKSMYGKRALAIYLATIAFLSILFGLVLDNYFDTIAIKSMAKHQEDFGIINYIATALMLSLMLYYWRKK
jgi:uncharacterized membrane protein YraQ (UPF0718 family)